MHFMGDEQVLLKVSPMKGVMHFRKWGKLSLRYIRLFEILQCVSPVAYRLELPPSLSGVHPVFHVSMLKKFHGNGNYIIHWDSVLLDENLSYGEESIVILDRDVCKVIVPLGGIVVVQYTQLVRVDDAIGLGKRKYWKWRSFTKVTLPIVVYRNSSYDKLVASMKQSGNLDCTSSNVVISYLMHSREKMNPTIINNDARVSLYMMNIDADGFRPILRINIVKRSFEGPMNSSPSPPQCRTADNDLNDYESDGDHPMNMEDDCVQMEDVLSDLQDAKEDCRTGSQLERKYETLDRFYIYKYVGVYMCGVEHATRKHKKMSSELIASLCVNYFRNGKGPRISEIQRIVFKELHCHAIYWMCWKGSVIAKNIIHWTPKHGYVCLPIFFHMVELLNPGSSYSIMVNQILACIRGYADIRKKLKSIVEDEPNLWVISDRYISIANAFSRVYSHAHHGLCVNQHCGEYLYLFYAMVKTYSLDEFSEDFEELKYNCLETAHVLENVLGFVKWSRAHFSGNRYEVMTTNIAKSLNSVLMDEWEYPVSYIFNSIAKKIGEKFRERYAYVNGKKNIFVPCVEKILRDNKSASDSLYATNPNGILDQYTVFCNGVMIRLNLHFNLVQGGRRQYIYPTLESGSNPQGTI
ncbi:hypothetical protein BC332_06867 [Capsicum chinense]|nr:hypothetical protein BC332_06867 [Capsicum chinense]